MNDEPHFQGSYLSPHLSFEDSDDNSIRPQSLEDFRGQKSLKDNLSVFLKAAKARQEALDHVFVSGPPGLGKTTLAAIMAKEMSVDFKATSAPALDKPKDLVGILTSLKKNSLFFIDEIHRLKPVLEEMLYIAMEDFEIDWVIGQGTYARNIRLPVPPFTLVGATTKPGSVSSPLYTRFGITLRIDLYSEEELAEIILRNSQILSLSIDPEAISWLARCSRGTPRVTNRLLRRMRDFAEVEGDGVITENLAQKSLKRLGIDEMGLEAQDRLILNNLIRMYQGGPVGVETLAISVGESVDSLEDFYEPYLIQKGFLQRTNRGRKATPLAYSHFGIDYDFKKKEDSSVQKKLSF